MQQNKLDAPAFPPQLMQDNFGKVVALVPGMSKVEFFAIMLLPKAIELNTKAKLKMDGEDITPFQTAVYWANQLFNELNKENEKDTLQIIK